MVSYRRQFKKETKKEGFEKHKKVLIELIKSIWQNEYNVNGLIRIDWEKNRQKQWKKIEQDYFKFVEDITGTKWEYDFYYCYGAVLSYVNFYAMQWGRNEILHLAMDTKDSVGKIARELFHAQQYSVFKELKLNKYFREYENNFIEISLILAFTHPDSPFDLNKDELINQRKEYLNEDLTKETEIIEKLWKKRKDFKSFVLEFYKWRVNTN